MIDQQYEYDAVLTLGSHHSVINTGSVSRTAACDTLMLYHNTNLAVKGRRIQMVSCESCQILAA